jgi:hypothetical protein
VQTNPTVFLNVIASEAKQSIANQTQSWIASSLCSSQCRRDNFKYNSAISRRDAPELCMKVSRLD